MAHNYHDLFQRPTRSFHTHITDFIPSSHFQTPMIIFNLLPTGLTLLTGPARSGKTSLALHLALDVATGEPALNSRIPTLSEDQQPYRTSLARVCYLALDSSDDHLHELTERLFAPRNIQNRLHFTLTNTLDDLTTKEGFLNLQAQLTSPNIGLLIIDNLAAIRQRFRGSDRDLLDILRRLAEQCHMSILVLHTGRASTPLVEHVDHHWHLSPLPISSYTRLTTSCRSLKARQYLLHCPSDTLSFRFATLAESASLTTISAPKVLSPERLAILHLIHSSETPLSPLQLATALDVDHGCMRQVLSQMHKANLLTTPTYGRYAISPTIQSLLPSLLDEVFPLTLLTLNTIPPDDSPEPNAANPHTSPSSSNSTNPHPDDSALLDHISTLRQLEALLSLDPDAPIPHTSNQKQPPTRHMRQHPQ
ncbi:AAA family ATPase [Ktedonospora formicarum]|uniref:AAA family ATPase n=1 Tax=Ktedonospora formicarum TaxID=2778364 RepID=UPI001C68D7EE|nr:AAA family ATPase [Ktedonospora formicarum]